MAHAQIYTVQPFIRSHLGQLTPCAPKQCGSAGAARKLAQRLVETKRADGALAYSSAGASSADEYDSPLFLARIGDVPESDDY